jgi:hypothetical protein
MDPSLMFVAVAAAFLAVWMLRRRRNRSRAVADSFDDLDDQVLKQLAAAGSDLSKPHDLEFFLYFSDEARAATACRQLTAEGYAGKVDRAAKGPQWMCFVTRRLVPDHAAMVAIRRRMNELAAAGGGEYDGWGTPVAP